MRENILHRSRKSEQFVGLRRATLKGRKAFISENVKIIAVDL